MDYLLYVLWEWGPLLIVMVVAWVIFMMFARRMNKPIQNESLELMRRNTAAMERIAKALENRP